MFQCTDDEGEFGVVYDNMTGDGVIGAVVERRADFGASSIDAWYHEFQFLDFASPLTRTGVTCLCPKPV